MVLHVRAVTVASRYKHWAGTEDMVDFAAFRATHPHRLNLDDKLHFVVEYPALYFDR